MCYRPRNKPGAVTTRHEKARTSLGRWRKLSHYRGLGPGIIVFGHGHDSQTYLFPMQRPFFGRGVASANLTRSEAGDFTCQNHRRETDLEYWYLGCGCGCRSGEQRLTSKTTPRALNYSYSCFLAALCRHILCKLGGIRRTGAQPLHFLVGWRTICTRASEVP